MKSSIIGIIVIVLLIAATIVSTKVLPQTRQEERRTAKEILLERALNNLEIYGHQLEKERTDWNNLIRAIMWVESRYYEQAVGEDNDIGVLQITPIYVKEVNRILFKKKYTLEDRYDSLRSVEMFNILQAYYNPSRDIHWAIKLHNPRAPLQYHMDIVRKYEEFVTQTKH